MLSEAEIGQLRDAIETKTRNIEAAARRFAPIIEHAERMQRALAASGVDLERAVERFTSLAKAAGWERTLERVQEMLAPGSFTGDLVSVALGGDDAADAVVRLTAAFTWGSVFHPTRARLLEPALRHYAAEADLTLPEAKTLLLQASLWAALRQPGQLASYDAARRYVRADVERALLDGRTLDQTAEDPWPEAADNWPDYDGELGALADLTLDQMALYAQLTPALQHLTPREHDALLGSETDGATRTARSRAMRKVREALGM